MARFVPVAILVGLALVGCGEAAQVEEPRGLRTSVREPSLVAERADGSRIDFPGRPLVWCGAWNDMIPAPALQVMAIGDVKPDPGGEWVSYWHLWALPDDVDAGNAVRFPSNFVWNRPRGAELFVGDAETKNEASTKAEGSSGRIVFAKAGCEPGNPVEFTIDAVVGSEFGDGEPITVYGSFRGVVAPAPAGWYD